MPGTDSHGDKAGSNYARFVGLGFTLLLFFAVPALGGYLLDSLLGTLPLFLLIGIAVGFAAGMYYVYQAISKLGSG